MKMIFLISRVFSIFVNCFDTFFSTPQQHRWRTKIPTKGNKVDLVPSMHRQWQVCQEDHDLFSSLLDNAPNLLVGCVILKGIMISIPLAMNWQFVFPENYSIVFLSFLDSPPSYVVLCTMGQFWVQIMHKTSPLQILSF